MRPTAALLLCLLVAVQGAAADEEVVGRVRFTGSYTADEADLRRAAEHDLARCLKALEDAVSAPAEAEGALQNARIAAEDAQFELARTLRNRGYPNSSVTFELAADGVTFDLQEGTRAFLGEVRAEGVDGELRGELEGLVRLPRSWLLGSRLLLRSELEATSKKMVAYLRQRGYLQARVGAPAFSPALVDLTGEEMDVDVRYDVALGPRTFLDSVIVLGMERHALHEVEDEFGDSIPDFVGEPFGPLTVYELQSVVVGFYATRGHPYAEVTWDEPGISEDGLSASVVLHVLEGPLVRIGDIIIEGRQATEPEAIFRELTFDHDEAFDSRKVAASRRHLHDTLLFGNVRVELPDRRELPSTDPVTADILVAVDEVDSRRLEAYVGFGSWDLLRAGASMTWLNLGGMAKTATVELNASVRGFTAKVRASNPWALPELLWDRTRGTLEISAEVQDRPTFSYESQEASLAFTRREVAPQLDVGFGYRYRSTVVTDVSGDLPEEYEDRASVSALFVDLEHDGRDDPWNPRQGSLVTAHLELANAGLGGDLDFFRGRLRALHLLLIDDSIVLVACAEVGLIARYGSTDEIPIQERYFLGGGETVRSFTQDDLGPRLWEDGRETNDAAGGEFFSRVNLELRVPVWGDLEGALFVDGGNVVENLADAGLGDYRYALGAGLRYRTPIGAARVDVGVNPNPREHEDRWAIFFSVGYPF